MSVGKGRSQASKLKAAITIFEVTYNVVELVGKSYSVKFKDEPADIQCKFVLDGGQLNRTGAGDQGADNIAAAKFALQILLAEIYHVQSDILEVPHNTELYQIPSDANPSDSIGALIGDIMAFQPDMIPV